MRRLILALLTVIVMAPAAMAWTEDNKTHFCWGAEFGSGIDMSGNDMSSIDFNAGFGMRRSWISFLGIGAGANIMVSNSCRTYPLFVCFRPSWPKLTKLLFLDIRGGAALNYLPNNASQTTPYGAFAVGINLARGKSFNSYILCGYSFIDRNDVTVDERVTPYKPLHMAIVRLGIAF